MSTIESMRRAFSPVAVGVFVALAGCDVVGGNQQPLSIVEQRPAGTSGGGATGSAGAADVSPVAGAPGLAGAPGGGSEIVHPPASGATCWDNQLSPEPRGPALQLTVPDACRLGQASTTWTFPTTSAARFDDRRAEVAGRWVSCGASTVSPPPHAGIEFGGNGRWQLLDRDATGALVGSEGTRGYYYVLGTGQLDLAGDGSGGPGTWIFFAKFADGNPDVLRFEGDVSTGIYVRVPASPLNGDENAPSVFDGRCSMVGTWDVPTNADQPAAPASTWSFDGAGNFVAGPRGANLCDGHTMYGTYQLADGYFELTTNWNTGLCDWWFSAAYPATFDADCSHVTVVQQFDNCTGGRGYLNGVTTLTRLR